MSAREALAGTRSAFAEINDLKRIVSAGRAGSIATRLFARGWASLVAGHPVDEVAFRISGRALAAARLGDLDRDVMMRGGLGQGDASAVLEAAVDAVIPPCGLPLAARLRVGAAAGPEDEEGPRPAFVEALADQPRAGITCPGKPRVLLEPLENHADHCLVVAVYGVLLSPAYGADPVRVFLAALAHHLHNAGMPDSGFTGEMLLGPHLDTLMARFTGESLSQLPERLRADVEAARRILPNADTPEGRAFHAADVLDRVLQCVQYTRAGSLTAEQMLGEMELVHAGPVKAFQDDVLRGAGLL